MIRIYKYPAWRLIRRVLSALACGIIIALIAAEVISRMAAGEGKIRTEPQFLITGTPFYVLTYDPVLGWKNTPGNFEGTLVGGERFGISIESHGFRGPKVDLKKAKDTYRILLLGDSVAWGWGVDQKDIFSRKLEDVLNGRPNRTMRYEVINAAVSGYGTTQELLFLKRWASKLKPDLILVFWYENDIENNLRFFEYQANRPILIVAGGDSKLLNTPCPVQLLKPIDPPLQLRPRSEFLGSVFYRFLMTRSLGDTAVARMLGAWGLWSIEPVVSLVLDQETWKHSADILKECQRQSAAEGASFVAILSTHRTALSGSESESPGTFVKKFNGDHFPVIDLFEEYRGLRALKNDLVLEEHNEHFSPKGHDAVAEILFRQLTTGGYIP